MQKYSYLSQLFPRAPRLRIQHILWPGAGKLMLGTQMGTRTQRTQRTRGNYKNFRNYSDRSFAPNSVAL